jgi:fructose-bisphosphate aldolase class I
MSILTVKAQQHRKIATQCGFIAALDQSGGSTPKALRAYGLGDDAWSTEEEMFDLVHRMRTRIVTSPCFNGDRVFGAILFEGTMDRHIEGQLAADYLWGRKRVVPFLKVDKGLAEERDGVRLMQPIPQLDDLLERANAKGIFGTKMRSVIVHDDPVGIAALVDQQFELAVRILDAGLMPIVEPEVDIHCTEKATAETQLLAALLAGLERLPAGRQLIFKLTLPEQDGLYADLVAHPNVLKVVALSGGYAQSEGNLRLRRNPGVVASFSRALVEGLAAHQSDADFDATLDGSIQAIFEASMT